MQTNSINNLLADEIIRKCVHCGFCLATCPTYQILGNELDSPRGRIYLIKSVLEKNYFSKISIQHLDRCLTCNSCETTCPSGVEYTQLLDIGRDFIKDKRPLWQKIYRYIVRKFLTKPLLFNSIGFLFRHSKIQTKSIFLTKSNLTKNQKKVLLLGGCIQPTLTPNINHTIKNILTKLGYEVLETPQKQCCGAIDKHLNATKDTLYKVKSNIDSWLKAKIIISSTSGCGAMIKDYALMFDKKDIYYKKAQNIINKTQDIAEFLADKDLVQLRIKKINISYHEPCTLQHGQKLGGLVESILKNLGYKLTPVIDSHLCCGSAGTYSIFQPKLAKQLKINKLKHLQKNNPQMIVTANIGCLIHLQKSTKTPVKHWIELLE